jgi:hypothetical protein
MRLLQDVTCTHRAASSSRNTSPCYSHPLPILQSPRREFVEGCPFASSFDESLCLMAASWSRCCCSCCCCLLCCCTCCDLRCFPSHHLHVVCIYACFCCCALAQAHCAGCTCCHRLRMQPLALAVPACCSIYIALAALCI